MDEFDENNENNENKQEFLNDLHEKHITEINKLLKECETCLTNNELTNAEKIIDQILINFDKWNELINMDPSTKPDNYDNLFSAFEKLREFHKQATNNNNNKEDDNEKKNTENMNNNESNNNNTNNKSSINWTDITLSGIIGIVIGATATYFLTNKD